MFNLDYTRKPRYGEITPYANFNALFVLKERVLRWCDLAATKQCQQIGYTFNDAHGIDLQ